MEKQKPIEIKDKLADSHYQPSKAELEQEYDMPALSDEQVMAFFFNPATPGRGKRQT